MITEALNFYDSGFNPIPCGYGTKKPLINWGMFQDQRPDARLIPIWFRNTVNIALICGVGGLTVIDFDNMQIYRDWLLWAAKFGGLPAIVAQFSRRAQTARGIHIYIRTIEVVNGFKLAPYPIDIKARGGYVIAPPSLHPSGAYYKFLNPNAPIMQVFNVFSILPARWVEESKQPLTPPAPNAINNIPASILDQIDSQPRSISLDIIKSTIKIESLIPGEKKQSGRYLMAWCPFHADREHGNSMSLWIDTNKNICGCFSCQFPKPLDVINVYSKLYSVSNSDAIKALAISISV